MADRFQSNIPAISADTEFRPDSPLLMARAYFLLSDAYKPWRNEVGSLTDEYKRAALSALAVMAIRPFSPLDPDNVQSASAYLANPIFALACANAWAAKRDLISHFPFDYLKRFYLSLDAVRIPPLDEFIRVVNEDGDARSIKSIELDRSTLIAIDDWVLKIYMLCNQRR